MAAHFVVIPIMKIARFKGGPLNGQEKEGDDLPLKYRVPVKRRPTPEDDPVFAEIRRARMAWLLCDGAPPPPPDPTLGDVYYRLSGIDGAVGVYTVESQPDWMQ